MSRPGEEWLVARKALLAREKEFTRQKDALNADRRRLPMVAVEKDYKFEGPEGRCAWPTFSTGKRQLIVYHFMFDPSWDDGCSACTAGCDELSDGLLDHLAAREHRLRRRRPGTYEKIAAYKEKRGWTFPFFSSFGSDFNYDFHATIDESKAPMEINFRTREDLAAPEATKLRWALDEEQPFENPGLQLLPPRRRCHLPHQLDLRPGHRGVQRLLRPLDQTALGRQEDWEEPKDNGQLAHEASPDFAE